jgi:hypothetical protein
MMNLDHRLIIAANVAGVTVPTASRTVDYVLNHSCICQLAVTSIMSIECHYKTKLLALNVNTNSQFM